MSQHLLVMAGGTGGHIFPGLAIAHAMRARGWRVSWLGTTTGMEQTLVPRVEIPLYAIAFEGIVGRGFWPKLALPVRLLRAVGQARKLLADLRPDVVIGMGGYPTVPGGLAASRQGIPMAIHQSDAVAGLANKLLARFADRVLVGFESVFESYAGKRFVTGNPIRSEFASCPDPQARIGERTGALRLLALGGSRGAEAINRILPAALALLPAEGRPAVMHQAGRGFADSTRVTYERAGVTATVAEFIEDSATALADCDFFVGRSGASTVSELAALGVASILVPYPHHKDQQQLHNARVLSEAGAATILEQQSLTAETLAEAIASMSRQKCVDMAVAAQTVARPNATRDICDILESLAKNGGAGR